MAEFAFNKWIKESPGPRAADLEVPDSEKILHFHRSLPGYHPTPLMELRNLAGRLNIENVMVKDESYRFNLKAFKVLGASYAISRFILNDLRIKGTTVPEACDFPELRNILRGKITYTLCTATDGNHGRAVAWTARLLNQRAVVYMPDDSVPSRRTSIISEGAELVIVDGTYDDAVRRAAEDAEKNGWQIISDTAYPAYETIPDWITDGYTTMFVEMEEILHKPEEPGVDIVLLQAGVGSFAAAAADYYNRKYGELRPVLVTVEPTEAACLLESARSGDGRRHSSTGTLRTIMAGLNCGTPSLTAWPVLRVGIDLFLAISDEWTEKAIRRYYYPEEGDRQIISGESGAAGLAALLAIIEDPALLEVKNKLNIGPDTRVLIFNTEGDTDPDNFRKIIRR
jgi:diaminopropionate ammonia-lyase